MIYFEKEIKRVSRELLIIKNWPILPNKLIVKKVSFNVKHLRLIALARKEDCSADKKAYETSF